MSAGEQDQAGKASDIVIDERQDQTPISSTAASFPIVGIGASAGGLAAFEAFFARMPSDAEPGMAFVLVQHLAQDRTIEGGAT